MGYSTWLFDPMSATVRLKILRKERELAQQEMAGKVGPRINQIRRYESGSARPSLWRH